MIWDDLATEHAGSSGREREHPAISSDKSANCVDRGNDTHAETKQVPRPLLEGRANISIEMPLRFNSHSRAQLSSGNESEDETLKRLKKRL